ncbi:hypothetical protein YC2023_105307 [Brassica napus]
MLKISSETEKSSNNCTQTCSTKTEEILNGGGQRLPNGDNLERIDYDFYKYIKSPRCGGGSERVENSKRSSLSLSLHLSSHQSTLYGLYYPVVSTFRLNLS